MNEINEKIANLIDKANRDLKAAEVLLKDAEADFHSGNICFHSQQCVEKYLKAYLIKNGVHAPKTHDLLYLIELCSDFNDEFKLFDLSSFVNFGVEIRYDDPIPSIDEAKAAIKTANVIANFIIKLL